MKHVIIAALVACLAVATVGCDKKKDDKGLLGALSKGDVVPEKDIVKEEVVTAPTLSMHLTKFHKRVLYCKGEYWTKMKYENIEDGFPPIDINGFDNDCLGMEELHSLFYDKLLGTTDEADAFLYEATKLVDYTRRLSFKLKKLGTRHLTALVKELKRMEGVLVDLDDKILTDIEPLMKADAAPATTWDTTIPAEVKAKGAAAPEALAERYAKEAEALVAAYKEFAYDPGMADDMLYGASFTLGLDRIKKLHAAYEKGFAAAPSEDAKKTLAAMGELIKAYEAGYELYKGDYYEKKKEQKQLFKDLQKKAKALTGKKKSKK